MFFIFVGKCIAQHEACTRQLLLVLGLAGSWPNPSNLCSTPSSTALEEEWQECSHSIYIQQTRAATAAGSEETFPA